MDGRTSRIQTARCGRAGDGSPVLVKLSGEFDVRYQKPLEDVLGVCLASGRQTLVDLSEVTFMDSPCVCGLAVHYQLGGGRLALCHPSLEVEMSVAACELEEWIDFDNTTGCERYSAKIKLVAGTHEPREQGD